jgi:hypothetical protein
MQVDRNIDNQQSNIKNMKTKWILMVAAMAMGFTASVQAIPSPISGTLTISGGADLDSDNLASATRVDAWLNPQVESRSGDFSGIAVNTAVTMTAPWTFTSGAHAALWSVGGFTFDLISSGPAGFIGPFLVVSGTGTISGNGFAPTLGTFNFSTQEPDADGVFSFSAANGSVPDGGTTVMLLGGALAGLGLLRKKLVA